MKLITRTAAVVCVIAVSISLVLLSDDTAALPGQPELVSINMAGTDAGNGSSRGRLLSADGRFVAFRSRSSDLVASDGNGADDVFVRDRQTGVTELVSVNSSGTDSANGISDRPSITPDGRFIGFASRASDVAPPDADVVNDLFLRDMQSGTTTLVSVNSSGTGSGNATTGSSGHDVTPDGRFVAFASPASDLVATDTNSRTDVFVRDLLAGATTLVSINSAGTDSANNNSGSPQISDDGRYVVFRSAANNLGPTDTDFAEDFYLRDLQTNTTTLVSVNSAGTDSANDISFNSQLTPDGRFVAFTSGAGDLVATDTNGFNDVFVRDLVTGTTTMASRNASGTNGGNDRSSSPEISADGDRLAFESYAGDLVANDSNGVEDAYLRNLSSGTTSLLSVNISGTDAGNESSFTPVVSADGSTAAFESDASDLVAVDGNGAGDVFVVSDTSGITATPSPSPTASPTATPTPTATASPTPSPTPTASPTPTPTPTPTVTPPAGESVDWGDVDCKDGVTTRDNQALLRYVLSQPPLSQEGDCPAIGSLVTTVEA